MPQFALSFTPSAAIIHATIRVAIIPATRSDEVKELDGAPSRHRRVPDRHLFQDRALVGARAVEGTGKAQ